MKKGEEKCASGKTQEAYSPILMKSDKPNL